MLSSLAVGLLGLGVTNACVSALQLPLLSSISADCCSDKIISGRFEEWLEGVRSEWGMKGLAIAVVRRRVDGSWETETKGYGIKSSAGDAVDEDVCSCPTHSSSLLLSSL